MIEKLKQAYKEEMEKAGRAIKEFPWDDKASYTEWMAQTYFYSSFSTRIISLAGSLFPYSKNDFHLRFMNHAREEKNHEKVMIRDLKDMDLSIDMFAENIETKNLYQNQYYWIQNINPISVYGYFLYLEGIAVEHGDYILDRVTKAYGGKSTQFLALHVDEDVGHVESHFKTLQGLSETELSLIQENMRDCAEMYENMIGRVARDRFQPVQSAA